MGVRGRETVARGTSVQSKGDCRRPLEERVILAKELKKIQTLKCDFI